MNSLCYLYWIRYPWMTDATKEGYIGITSTTVKTRFRQHIYKAKAGGYSKEFRQALLSGDVIVETLTSSFREGILQLERVFRPKQNIGWNKAIGNDGGSNIKHGLTGTLVAKRYYNLLTRTKRSKDLIESCWLGPEGLINFYRDMGECPDKTFVLSRKNISLKYGPSNCIWETRSVLFNRYNKTLEMNGELYSYTELANLLGMKQNTLLYKLKRGKSVEDIIRNT